MAQMYKVEDDERKLIMIAPLETIQRIWRLENPAIARIAAETAELRGVCTLHTRHEKWGEVFVQRLPLELALRHSCGEDYSCGEDHAQV